MINTIDIVAKNNIIEIDYQIIIYLRMVWVNDREININNWVPSSFLGFEQHAYLLNSLTIH